MSTALKTLKIYTAYWKKHPVLFGGTLLIGPAYVLQAIIFPLFIAKSLAQLVNHTPVHADYLWYAALSLMSGAVLRYIADHEFHVRLTTAVTEDIYNTNLRHILKQEYDFFANRFGGSLVAQANRFAKGYEGLSNTIFLDSLGLISGVIVAIGIMIHYNPLIGVSVGVIWLLGMAVVTYLGIRRMPYRRRAVAEESKQTGELADIITNAITVKTFAQEATEEKNYAFTNKIRGGLFRRSWSVAVRNWFGVTLIAAALQLVVMIGGIQAVMHGSLSIAAFLLFQVYILRVIDSLGQGMMVVRQVEGVLGDAHEMTELLERSPAIQDQPATEKCRIQNGSIAFTDVLFDYNHGTKPGGKGALLQRFNIRVQPGEKIGLVGPSGGGKTTLTKLLLRFIDVQGGAITIDGQDIRNIKQDDLHRAIAYVPQEPIMFHRSIKENIRYGKPGASDQEVIQAAKRAHAHEFIKDLPEGYDTLVGERGIKLSGGQRQRVAIARAMIKNAPVLVLDEATSALDSESEAYIQDSLWKLMQGKTAIAIAHRLSTIQKMDRIIVLEGGNITEEGSHKELLARNGTYAKLWAHQSGGFIEE